MQTKDQPNAEQAALWNGPSGQAWIEAQATLDQMFRGFEDLLAERAAGARATRVLDVGCGTGATTLAMARRLGSAAQCTGVDISAPMLELARQRARNEGIEAQFVQADAQTREFPAGHFDFIASRFGVMFFADPVAAFANLRRASHAGASLCCLVFRAPAENPFMTAAERAVAPLLPELPPRVPNAPGQFAFADATRVQSLLHSTGWRDVALIPVDVPCAFPAQDLQKYFTRLGPVSQVLQKVDAARREEIIVAARRGFEPFVHGPVVRFIAACWEISAHA
jgi:SAM-dependent methyltransferase